MRCELYQAIPINLEDIYVQIGRVICPCSSRGNTGVTGLTLTDLKGPRISRNLRTALQDDELTFLRIDRILQLINALMRLFMMPAPAYAVKQSGRIVS